MTNAVLLGQPSLGGMPGPAGSDGSDGLSAYEVAVADGYSGTEADWLDSLVGPQGEIGESFTVDATGPTADRSLHDSEAAGFSFLDTTTGELFIREGASGWSDGIPFGKGDKGDKGDTGDQGSIIHDVSGVPGTVTGKTGDWAISDDADRSLYEKTDASTWTLRGNLRGPAGQDGADGDGLPVASIAFFPVATEPTGYLACDGSAISRTAYSALFAVLGTLYGAGDGSTTFNLPDLRGEFIRGFDDGRGVDSGRTIGSWQDQGVQSHTHGYAGAISTGVGDGSYMGAGAEENIDTTDPFGGAETRPRNIALLAMIKY